MGVEDRFPQRPHFLLLFQFLLLLGHPDAHGLGKLLHRCIQHLLMDTVRTAIAFSTPMVAPTDILHTPVIVPVPDHRHKGTAALFAENQSSVNGFDYYDVKKGTVESGSTTRIAMWMLDTDYDGMCIDPKQVFFPMGGKKDGWNKLAKTLKAEIDPDLIEKYAGNESLWFTVQPNSQIAVKIIDDRGIESLKVIKVGDE